MPMHGGGTATTQDLDARVHDRSLQIADRVLDAVESPMQPGERVLDDLLGDGLAIDQQDREADQGEAVGGVQRGHRLLVGGRS